jgi:hypothetical protein
MLAMEYGFKQREDGNNLETARANFRKLLTEEK